MFSDLLDNVYRFTFEFVSALVLFLFWGAVVVGLAAAVYYSL